VLEIKAQGIVIIQLREILRELKSSGLALDGAAGGSLVDLVSLTTS
jgi:hypothetical protein